MDKKISVIIPVYNVEKYLRECLDSVISQTLAEIEIVCVNDGSRDGSRDILSEYEKKDARIVVVDKENGGLSSARNCGLDVAKGEYVYFLDSDDLLNSQEALSELYQKAEENKLDQLFFDAEAFFENEEVKQQNSSYITYYERKGDYPDVKCGKDLFCEFQANRDFKPNVGMQLYRRRFLVENQLTFYEGILHEDAVFTMECVTLSKRTAYVKKSYLRRRIRENSIVTTLQKSGSIYGYYYGIMILLDFGQKQFSIWEEPFLTFYFQRIQDMMELAAKLYPKEEEEKKKVIGGINQRDQFTFTANMNMWQKAILLKSEVNEKSKAYRKSVKERNELETVKKDLETSKKNLEVSKKRLEKEIENIKKSTSYKVGRAVTWGPRKVKRALKSLKPEDKLRSSKEGEIYLIGTPEFGNLGDHMISKVELELLYMVYPHKDIHEVTMSEYWKKKEELKSKITLQDVLIFHGGGNIGNLWPKSEYIRRDAFLTWKNQRKIIMPQSIFFSNDVEGEQELLETKKVYSVSNLLLCCRDKMSYQFAVEKFPCKSIYVPDTVLFHRPQEEETISRDGAILCLREYKEKKLTDQDKTKITEILGKKYKKIVELDTVGDRKTRETREEGLRDFFAQIRGAEIVVTDRLHGMIFCVLTGTPCVALDNSYGKVYGAYEWLKELEYIKYINEPEELEKWIDYPWKNNYRYPVEKYREKFCSLLDQLK